MPARYCALPSCSSAAARGRGSCVLCSRHFCTSHIKSEYHSCPPVEDESGVTEAAFAAERQHVIDLLELVDGAALAYVASDIRGISCTIPALDVTDSASQYEMASGQMGGQNCNLDIIFDDGVVWIARIRLSNNPRLPPQKVQDYVLRSEVATLKYLETTKVPAPKVFAFDCAPNNVGVSYALVEKMPGTSLMPGWPPDKATPEQSQKLLEQLADIYIELSSCEFRSTGSLLSTRTLDRIEVGGFAHADFFEDAEAPPIGPFRSTESAMISASLLHLKMIRSGELADLPVDNYLRHLWRLDVLREGNLQLKTTESRFFLRHRDDKGDHILVNSDFNITGLLDWEWASVEHPSTAFNSPLMLWPVGDFYAGSQQLSEAEYQFARILKNKGLPELADYILNGRLMQRLDFAMIEYPSDVDEFASLLQGLRKAIALAQTGSEDVSSYAAWREEMLERHAGDKGLQQILR